MSEPFVCWIWHYTVNIHYVVLSVLHDSLLLWYVVSLRCITTPHTTTVLRPLFWDHPGEPVPEENFWTSWCKGRLTEADTLTIRLGATPSGLTSAHLHHHPVFFTGRMPFLPPNQQRQSTQGNQRIRIREKTLEFSSTVLPAPSPYRCVVSMLYLKLECGPMPNLMVALPNIGGALCSTPQSLADAHY